MPTTTYVDTTMSASAIGARTDSSGTAVVDYSAEEARLVQAILGAGWLTVGAFTVAAQATPNMTVKVGSGTAKADLYVLVGSAGGQGTYLARLDVSSINVTIGAADVSQNRTDEVYLVILDNTYDSSTRSLPRLGYRKGDLGGANPGPDATWKAYALLARVSVAANATTVTNSNITDQRTAGGLKLPAGGQVNLGGSGSGAVLAEQVASTVTSAQAVRVSGDTTDRFTTAGDGTMSWGSGSGAADTTLARASAGVLRTGGDMQVVGGTSLPRGIVARQRRTTDSSLAGSSNTTPSTGLGVMSLSCSMVAGRLYRVSIPSLDASAQTASHGSAQLNYTIDGSTPGPTSTRMTYADADFNGSSQLMGLGPIGGTYAPSSNITFKVLLSIYTNNGANFATAGNATAPLDLIIEDLGVDPGSTGTNL